MFWNFTTLIFPKPQTLRLYATCSTLSPSPTFKQCPAQAFHAQIAIGNFQAVGVYPITEDKFMKRQITLNAHTVITPRSNHTCLNDIFNDNMINRPNMNVTSAHGRHMTGALLKFTSAKNIRTWFLFSVLNVTVILGKSGTIHYIYYKVIILFTNGIKQPL